MIGKDERTLVNLRSGLKGKIYIRSASKEIFNRLLRDAKSEGFTAKGKDPCSAFADNQILKLGRDKTLESFGGMWSHMAYDNAEDIYRIDYGRYISGKSDYLDHETIGGKLKHETYSFKSRYSGAMRISGPRHDAAYAYYVKLIDDFDSPEEERLPFTEMEHIFTVLVIE